MKKNTNVKYGQYLKNGEERPIKSKGTLEILITQRIVSKIIAYQKDLMLNPKRDTKMGRKKEKERKTRN